MFLVEVLTEMSALRGKDSGENQEVKSQREALRNRLVSAVALMMQRDELRGEFLTNLIKAVRSQCDQNHIKTLDEDNVEFDIVKTRLDYVFETASEAAKKSQPLPIIDQTTYLKQCEQILQDTGPYLGTAVE